MERPKHDPAATSREDDFRDSEERDLNGGWPYADEDALGKPGNAGYGMSDSNFDRAARPPAEIAEDTEIDSSGGPAPALSSVDPAIEDDSIGERIAVALESNGLDGEVLTITVHDGVAELEGRIDTDEEKSELLRVALAVPGVRNVTDKLTLSGVDSHIPSDVTE
jgi:HSP20 family molecular chaperone IbpA